MDVWSSHSPWADNDEQVDSFSGQHGSIGHPSSQFTPGASTELPQKPEQFHHSQQPWDDLGYTPFSGDDGADSSSGAGKADGFAPTGWIDDNDDDDDDEEHFKPVTKPPVSHFDRNASADPFPDWGKEDDVVVETVMQSSRKEPSNSDWAATPSLDKDRSSSKSPRIEKNEGESSKESNAFSSPWGDHDDAGWGSKEVTPLEVNVKQETEKKEEGELREEVGVEKPKNEPRSEPEPNNQSQTDGVIDPTSTDDAKLEDVMPKSEEEDGFGDFAEFVDQEDSPNDDPGSPDIKDPMHVEIPSIPPSPAENKRTSWVSSRARDSWGSADYNAIANGRVAFEINVDALKSLFKAPKEEMLSPVPNIIQTTEARKIWYRLSAPGLDRHGDAGDDVVRVKWSGSKVQSSVHEIVSRWMKEDRASGRTAIDGGIQGGSFGWGEGAEFKASKVDMNALKRFTSPPRMGGQFSSQNGHDDMHSFAESFGGQKKPLEPSTRSSHQHTPKQSIDVSSDGPARPASVQNATFPGWGSPPSSSAKVEPVSQNTIPAVTKPPPFASYFRPSMKSPPAAAPPSRPPTIGSQSPRNSISSLQHTRGLSGSSFTDDWGTFRTSTASSMAPPPAKQIAPPASSRISIDSFGSPPETGKPPAATGKSDAAASGDVWGSFDIFEAKPFPAKASKPEVSGSVASFGPTSSSSLNTLSLQTSSQSTNTPQQAVPADQQTDEDDDFGDWGEMVGSPVVGKPPDLTVKTSQNSQPMTSQAQFPMAQNAFSNSATKQDKRMSLPPSHTYSSSLGDLQDIDLLGSKPNTFGKQAPSASAMTFDSLFGGANTSTRPSGEPANNFDSMMPPPAKDALKRNSMGGGSRSVSSPVTQSPLRQGFTAVPAYVQSTYNSGQPYPSRPPAPASANPHRHSLIEMSRSPILPLVPTSPPPLVARNSLSSFSSQPSSPKLPSSTLGRSQSTRVAPVSRNFSTSDETKTSRTASSSISSQNWSIDDFSIFESKTALPPTRKQTMDTSPSLSILSSTKAVDRRGGIASPIRRQPAANQVPQSPITGTPVTRDDLKAENDAAVDKIVARLPDLSFMLR